MGLDLRGEAIVAMRPGRELFREGIVLEDLKVTYSVLPGGGSVGNYEEVLKQNTAGGENEVALRLEETLYGRARQRQMNRGFA